MRKMMNLMGRIRREEEGQSMVEYGLLIALIAIVVAAVLVIFGPQLAGLFTNVSNTL
jgi:pilus assembly protein Flp/PilA